MRRRLAFTETRGAALGEARPESAEKTSAAQTSAVGEAPSPKQASAREGRGQERR